MGRYQDASFAGHSTASQLPEPIFPLNLIKIILPLRMMIQLESWYRVTESYSGENVGHRPGERAAVLHRATIGITEIAIRFQNEITLAATITPRPRTMRDDRRPPTLRNCTELSTAPRVSARAFPVDANLRDLARLHAGHGAILRFNQSLGYGKLRGSDDESFPCPLQTSQHGQIGAEIVAGGCLDVAVTELSCDH